jgi:hypothetical protein
MASGPKPCSIQCLLMYIYTSEYDASVSRKAKNKMVVISASEPSKVEHSNRTPRNGRLVENKLDLTEEN